MTRTKEKTAAQRVLQLLQDNIPRFRCEILAVLGEKGRTNLTDMWMRGELSRSDKPLPQPEGGLAYAYSTIENAGKTITWTYNGVTYTAKFVAKNRRRKVKDMIIEVLKDSDVGLFSDEIHARIRGKFSAEASLKRVRNALTELYRKGRVSRLDNTKGWKFSRGYLYGLNMEQIQRRLASVGGPLSVYSDLEGGLLKQVEHSVKRAADIRRQLSCHPSLLTWIARKLGSEGPYKVKTIKARGRKYRVEIVKNEDTEAKDGLIPWLKWIKVGGELIFYDSRLPEGYIKRRIAEISFWLTEEGKRRCRIGLEWEQFTGHLFNILDKKGEWKLTLLKHEVRWKGSSKTEFDHVYEYLLGPPEFDLKITMVVENKAGILTTRAVDQFYSKLINEPRFRNWETGGLKTNVIPVFAVKGGAEKQALQKCTKMGIKVIFDEPLKQTLHRLTENRQSGTPIYKPTPTRKNNEETREAKPHPHPEKTQK